MLMVCFRCLHSVISELCALWAWWLLVLNLCLWTVSDLSRVLLVLGQWLAVAVSWLRLCSTLESMGRSVLRMACVFLSVV